MTARAGDAQPVDSVAGRPAPAGPAEAADTAAAVTAKTAWRVRIRAARRTLDPVVRVRHAGLLTDAVLGLAARAGGPVCAYLPSGTEPWSPAGVEVLRAAGHEVLLPVVAGAGPLDWARHTGPDALVPGPFGLREPAGPRLGPAVVATARLVLIPALAADRRGVRLGQGGGFYDRTLPLVAPGVPLVVVLGEGELVDLLPAEAHDRRVSAAVLPSAGVTMLGDAG